MNSEPRIGTLAARALVIDPGDFNEVEGSRQYRVPISRRIGARDIIQTINRYQAGVSPVRRNEIAEEVLYVVNGNGRCSIDGNVYELDSGTALYIPPATTYQIECSSGAQLEAVSVCCPEERPSEAGFELSAREDTKRGSNHESEKRELPMLVIHEQNQPAIPTGDREFKLLASHETGAKRVTQFIGIIPPGRAPMHHHTYEEAIYIIEGRGILWTHEGSSEFGPGTSIYLPRGVSHCLENTGTSNVKLLGVFHPSGSPAARYEK